MGGLFAEWQPEYAARGIPTFPVRDKRPAVSNYLRMGLPASTALTAKFGDADGIGLACGERSRITVVDVDSPSESELSDAMAHYGPTPFIVQSGSGHFHAWYRHNGERREIRPDKARPIDVLGGGYVVAPPSRTPRGDYKLISGTLDDLTCLPYLLAPEQPSKACAAIEIAGERVAEGKRNDTLWRLCMERARECAGMNDLMEFAMQANRERFYVPLPAEEVVRVVASAWEKEANGENFFGGRKGLVIPNEQVDSLLLNFPDAFILLAILKRHHWGREFVCANAMAKMMPPNGWSRLRFAAARQILLDVGGINLVRPASKQGGAAIYRFKGVRK